MITSQFFNISSTASVFTSNRHIGNKQHCAVWIKDINNAWSQLSYNDFDLVNNSIILDTPLISTLAKQVELRVADSQEELGTPVNDISTVSSVRDEVVTVADNIDDIVSVSSNISSLNDIADNLVKIPVVSENIDSIIEVANRMQDVLNAIDSAISASNSKDLAEKWASELEDVIVAFGKYSAYHWARKAESIVVDGVIDDTGTSVSTTYSSNKLDSLLALKANLLNPSFSNHIGIGGVTVSNWGSALKVVEGDGGVFFGTDGTSALSGSNAYYDGTNWRYKANGTAGLQLVNQGDHTFRVAISGVADAIITWVTIASLSADSVVLPSNTEIGAVSATELQYLDGVTSNVQGQITTLNTQLNNKAPLSSPALTGTPTAPTQTAGDNSTKLATTAYVDGKMVRGTIVNSTSGTSIDFTGIPSWAKKITVMFNGVSVSGTSLIQIQLGTSSGIETTSYSGGFGRVGAGADLTGANLSNGFLFSGNASASDVFYGMLNIANVSSNVWVANGGLGIVSASNGKHTAVSGAKTLSGALDRIRITTVNGTDTFDAGSINIIYEG